MKYLKQRWESLQFALQGISEVGRNEPNFKIHLFIGVLTILLGFYFRISTIEWCLVLLCIFLVFAAEAFNSAIEYLTDLVSPEYHILAKKTKDAAAGAVLFIALGALLVGLILFLPKFYFLFF